MGKIVQFKRKSIAEKHKGNTLCRSGFHQWQLLKEQQFDVRLGKLLTVYQCSRCQKLKNKFL